MRYDHYGSPLGAEVPEEKATSRLENPAVVAKIRQDFSNAVKETMTHPSFPLMDYHDTELPEKIRNGGKAPRGGYWEDILIAVCVRLKISALNDIDHAKEIFLE